MKESKSFLTNILLPNVAILKIYILAQGKQQKIKILTVLINNLIVVTKISFYLFIFFFGKIVI